MTTKTKSVFFYSYIPSSSSKILLRPGVVGSVALFTASREVKKGDLLQVLFRNSLGLQADGNVQFPVEIQQAFLEVVERGASIWARSIKGSLQVSRLARTKASRP